MPTDGDEGPPGDGNDWVSAHVFYHGELDRVVVDLVDPLVRELAAGKLAPAAFFLRYWDGGPHVRLRLLPGPAGPEPVRARVEQRCAEFFRTRPAPGELDPARYAPWAAELAQGEEVTDYHRRPFPNNSVAFLPYRREHDRYGHGAAMAAVERHFVESSRIALALLAAGLPAGRRDTAALSMLLLAWFCLPSPGEVRLPADAGAEESYQRQQDTLRQLADRMRRLAAQPAASGESGALAVWHRSVARLQTALADAGAGARDTARIVDLCAHLVCNRLGVDPPGEARLRYLAARTVAPAAAAGAGQGTP